MNTINEKMDAILDWCGAEDNDAYTSHENLANLLQERLDEETYNKVVNTLYDSMDADGTLYEFSEEDEEDEDEEYED